MIDNTTARQRALDYLNRPAAPGMRYIERVILDDHTREEDFGWVFFPDSKRFIETGNPGDILAGNGPLIVRKDTGAIDVLGSTRPADEAIAAYRRRLDMPELDRDTAQQHVLALLNGSNIDVSQSCVIVAVREEVFGWVFFWCPQQALQSGGPSRDDAPMIVNKVTDEIFWTGTSHEPEYYIAAYAEEIAPGVQRYDLLVTETDGNDPALLQQVHAVLGLSMAAGGALRSHLPGAVYTAAYMQVKPLYDALKARGVGVTLRRAVSDDLQKQSHYRVALACKEI
jgi:hypothetical protein